MVDKRGVDRPAGPAGLTGYRYVLAVALLAAMAWLSMLAAVAAGAATLGRSGPPAGEATPFITYGPPTSPALPAERVPVRSDRGRDRPGGTLLAGSDWWPRDASRMLSEPPAGPDRDGGVTGSHAVR